MITSRTAAAKSIKLVSLSEDGCHNSVARLLGARFAKDECRTVSWSSCIQQYHKSTGRYFSIIDSTSRALLRKELPQFLVCFKLEKNNMKYDCRLQFYSRVAIAVDRIDVPEIASTCLNCKP